MNSKYRSRLTFANVTSLLALFVALGGTATAAIVITGKNVRDGSLTGRDVKNNSVGSQKIKDGNLLARDFKAGQLPAGAHGLQGTQGAQGAQGTAGADGQNGAPGPSDIYVVGNDFEALDITGGKTEVASVTVPAGSYLLGANLWLTKFQPGTSQVNCRLESSDTPPRTLWDASFSSQLTDTSSRSNLSLAGADTFTADQIVKVFCGAGPEATNAVNVRLWAIKTGNLHATLPLPND
jgi:hypothetical protein